MYESPYKPKFAVVVKIEPVMAHYYRVAGLSPLYLTGQDGVNTDPALARTYSSKANARRAGERAMKALAGIESFDVEQINQRANERPQDVRVRAR